MTEGVTQRPRLLPQRLHTTGWGGLKKCVNTRPKHRVNRGTQRAGAALWKELVASRGPCTGGRHPGRLEGKQVGRSLHPQPSLTLRRCQLPARPPGSW